MTTTKIKELEDRILQLVSDNEALAEEIKELAHEVDWLESELDDANRELESQAEPEPFCR